MPYNFKKHKYWWIALGVIVALGVIPLLIPLNMFRARIEAAASEALHQPVTIERVGFTLLPLPAFRVSGIAVGSGGEIKVGTVSVKPDWFSLGSATKVINNIAIDDVHLKPTAFGFFGAVMRKAGGKDAPAVEIRDGEIEIRKLMLESGEDTVGPLHVVAKYTDEGTLRAIGIATDDARLRVALTATDTGFRITGDAPSGWTVPIGTPFKFRDLAFDGVMDGSHVHLSRIAGHAYDGSFDGELDVRWGDRIRLDGSMSLEGIELTDLISLIKPSVKAGGKLSAKPKFSATFDNGQDFRQSLRVETDFNVQDGIYYGLDLAKAATLFLKTGAKGGETRFDRLSGHVLREHEAYQISNLKISSGLLAAEGNVTVSPSEALGGVITAKVSNSALGFATAIPLQLSGTLASPMLFPTKSALAGAAAGTLLMPGVGTGVGAGLGNKAGELVDKLFGGKKK